MGPQRLGARRPDLVTKGIEGKWGPNVSFSYRGTAQEVPDLSRTFIRLR